MVKSIKYLAKVGEKLQKILKEFLGHLPIHQDLRSSADLGDL